MVRNSGKVKVSSIKSYFSFHYLFIQTYVYRVNLHFKFILNIPFQLSYEISILLSYSLGST